MKHAKLNDMTKGWFVGMFTPSIFFSKNCEVGVKSYKKGDKEFEHFHKISTEITLIISGQAKMMGKVWSEGDIILIEPNESTSFSALTDVLTVVIKFPAAHNDKYFSSSNEK